MQISLGVERASGCEQRIEARFGIPVLQEWTLSRIPLQTLQ